ncbi:uncharacterized protein LOC110710053 isoform X2 [Chenopodium quinoa]|uniref:uncharacterized protein LOC110710053 isoform X2 n=1 Tax=Chenopodium quinoa TaxID=63459 RepID=UPI000B7972EB|nr:uncharacterized protein LOC110710053 isoform X2 [Chenopodium quinoa]
MAGLPRLITLRGNRFFQYETEEGELHATVRNTSDTIISENNFTLFEVVSSRVQGMVHIKSRFNNRYLRLNPTGVYIYATADELEEDRAKRSCTLFRVVVSGYNVRFFHQSDNVERGVIYYQNGVLGVQGIHTYSLLFRDMTDFVILPKHVMFKGNDGNYLRARKNRNLEFVANDPTDPRVHHIATVSPLSPSFSLLSPRFNLYWERINGDWLQCNSSRPFIVNTAFRPVRQGFGSQNNTIALLNTNNNRYCERWTSGGNAGRIRASSSTVPPTAVLTVEEAVRDREISDIRYRLEDARIYNMVPLQAVSQTVFNYGNHDERQEVKFTYREVIEEKFSSSHSWKLSVKATIRVRLIPVILQGKLTTTASYGGSVEWSKMKRIERTVTGSTTATVPARSSRRVTLIVGQGSMDVPYSYRQSDILMDGTFEEKTMHDGLFSGLNTFEFQYTLEEPESLPRSARPPIGHDDIVIVPGETMDLPRMAISRGVDEVEVEGKEEELVPMEQDCGEEGKEEPVPLPVSSKL